MAQPYVGEIRIFAGNFAPAGWAFCHGQLLPISENETLFQLIGTTYGGDGESTFALPDLQSRAPIHQGTNPGTGSTFVMAETGGVETVTLTVQQIPIHTHPLIAANAPGTSPNPPGRHIASSPTVDAYIEDVASVSLAANAVAPVGGSQPHTNLQPYLALNFIISLFGLFPPPN
jgi:microcystin-dependent protein